MDILYINNVYVNYIVLKIFWYTHQNIVIYWLKYFDMLCLCFVRDIQPQDWTLCCWSSSFSECQDRLPIRRGNIHLLSMCTSTVAAIPCCNSRRGSHVYEINTWLWNFGRPQPRVGGLSVAKTEKIRRKSRSEASKRGWATKKARTWLPHGICIVYTMYIPGIYCLVVKLDFWVKLSWCPEMPCCLHAFPLPLTSIASLKTGETWTLLIQVYV